MAINILRERDGYRYIYRERMGLRERWDRKREMGWIKSK